MFELGYAVGLAAIPLLVGATYGYFSKSYIKALVLAMILCVVVGIGQSWIMQLTAAIVCALMIGIFASIRVAITQLRRKA